MPPLQLPECPPSTIQRHARELHKKLFKSGSYKYTLTNIVTLLNQVSGYEETPHNDIKWGYAVLSMIAIQNMFNQLGTRGTHKLQQVKQGIAAAMLYLNGDKIMNKPLLKAVLPHKDNHARNDWIDKCIDRRRLCILFDEPEFFADNGQVYPNPSYVQK